MMSVLLMSTQCRPSRPQVMGPRNFSEFATNEACASESTAQVNRSGRGNGLTGKGHETARFYHPHMGLTQYSYKTNLKNQHTLDINECVRCNKLTRYVWITHSTSKNHARVLWFYSICIAPQKDTEKIRKVFPGWWFDVIFPIFPAGVPFFLGGDCCRIW